MQILHMMHFFLFIIENMLNIILYHTNQKIQKYLMNFDGSRQQLNLMHEATLDKIRAVIGLVIYGGVFESSHENLESLYKMDGTGRLIFLLSWEKIVSIIHDEI